MTKGIIHFIKITTLCLFVATIFNQNSYAINSIALKEDYDRSFKAMAAKEDLIFSSKSIVFQNKEVEKDLKIKNNTLSTVNVKEIYFSPNSATENNFDEAMEIDVSEECKELGGKDACEVKITSEPEAKSGGPVPLNIVYDIGDQKTKF